VPGANWRANLGSLPLGIRSSLSAWLTREPSYPVSKTSKIEHQARSLPKPSKKSHDFLAKRQSGATRRTSNLNWPRGDKRSHRSLGVNPRTLTGLDVTLAEGTIEGVTNLGANPSTPFPCPSFPKIFFPRNQPNHSQTRARDTFPHLSLQ